MAAVEQCEQALAELADRLHAFPEDDRSHKIPDRTIHLVLLDLDVVFVARLHEGSLVDIHQERPRERPQIRLTMNSDDLIDLTERRLAFAHAWATGRLHLDASLRDLLRLRLLMSS